MPHKLHRHTLGNTVSMQHRHHRSAQTVESLTMPHPAIPGPLLPTQPDTMQPHKLRKLWAGITMHTQPRQHPGSRIPALRLVPGIPLTRPLIPPSSIGCCKRRPRHQPHRLSRPSLPLPSQEPRISRARIIVSRNRQSAQLPLQHRIQQLPHRQIILVLSLHLSRGRQLLGHQTSAPPGTRRPPPAP